MYNRKIIFLPFLAFLILNLFGCCCTTSQVNHTCPISLPCATRVALLPFTNATETPQADARAQAITTVLLRSRGINNLLVYPPQANKQCFIPCLVAPLPRNELLAWARSQNACYALTGTVNEWRYKIGLDGEPVVGVTLELIDVNNNCVIWSAVGSRSGGCRTAVSTVAQGLIADMLRSLYSSH